jgi:hypothetical protein
MSTGASGFDVKRDPIPVSGEIATSSGGGALNS